MPDFGQFVAEFVFDLLAVSVNFNRRFLGRVGKDNAAFGRAAVLHTRQSKCGSRRVHLYGKGIVLSVHGYCNFIYAAFIKHKVAVVQPRFFAVHAHFVQARNGIEVMEKLLHERFGNNKVERLAVAEFVRQGSGITARCR